VATLCFVPDSPRWLLSVGRREDAERALRELRGRANVSQELHDIETAVKEASAQRAPSFWEVLSSHSRMKPLVIVIGLALFQQATVRGACSPPPRPRPWLSHDVRVARSWQGINAVLYNASGILAAVGVTDSDLAALVVIGPQVLVSAAACAPPPVCRR